MYHRPLTAINKHPNHHHTKTTILLTVNYSHRRLSQTQTTPASTASHLKLLSTPSRENASFPLSPRGSIFQPPPHTPSKLPPSSLTHSPSLSMSTSHPPSRISSSHTPPCTASLSPLKTASQPTTQATAAMNHHTTELSPSRTLQPPPIRTATCTPVPGPPQANQTAELGHLEPTHDHH